MTKVNFDFSGYATKNGLRCADGRTILKDAFKHQNGTRVPLVWQHLHNEPGNVLGHAILENREDGVYCRGKFNDTETAQTAKELVEHGDISALSIHANQLRQRGPDVLHGTIREVSLVLAGANPGAFIDNLSFAHADGSTDEDDSEAIIYTGLEFSHADSGGGKKEKTLGDVFDTLNEEQKDVVYALIAKALEESDDEDDEVEHSDAGDQTVADVFNTLNEEQKNVVYAMIAHAIDTANDEDNLDHSNNEGDIKHMKRNVFDQNNQAPNENTLTHDQMSTIVTDAKRFGSLKESFIAHATEYGFDPINVLFPDAVSTNSNGPEIIKRDDTWVDIVLGESTHTPFARIKTTVANITADEARAKGYVTGSLKKDEIIPLLKRVTSPTTIYKKQKLDRDDMIDITDFDVVVWLKKEMRGMLNEELARAILIGDGRSASDEDKINEGNIRPIVTDDPNVYIDRTIVPVDKTTDEIIDAFILARKNYKGSGSPTLYTSTNFLTDMLLIKDTLGRRLYNNVQELASVLRVSKIVEVEMMNTATRNVSEGVDNSILGVVVNMKDYTIGADKGGQVAMFDDFDIDYNQYKYLIETRVSGALTKPKSALVIEQATAAG